MAVNATATALTYGPNLTAADPGTSLISICSFGLTLLWGSIELIISIGAITAFSHLLCFAAALSMPTASAASPSASSMYMVDLVEEADAAHRAEKTAALMLSGLLSGLHVVLVLVGLPLAGFGDESFPLRNLYSIAVLAALTTALVMCAIMLCLLAPVAKACGGFVVARCGGSGGRRRAGDLEAQTQQQQQQQQREEQRAFLEKAVFQIDVKDVDAEEQ
ncbi:hypothetical protein MBLNU459_g6380t2 [Dothideomycetes sp. NU459]